MEGWIKIHRKMIHTDLWLQEPFTRPQAWIDLIALANYKDGFVRTAGQRIAVERGAVGWSKQRLAARWQWSRGKVDRFLDELEGEQMIVRRTDTRFTIITICNYDTYQDQKSVGSTADRTADDTGDEQETVQETGRKQSTNKKDKKGKKEKKRESAGASRSEPEEYKAVAQRLLNHICEYEPKHKYNRNAPNIETWAKDLRLAVERDGETAESLVKFVDWLYASESDTAQFWRGNILSGKAVRDKISDVRLKYKNEQQRKQGKSDSTSQYVIDGNGNKVLNPALFSNTTY